MTEAAEKNSIGTKAAGKPVPAKLAVVLLNLGGPLQDADIPPFLFSFFRDKNVITLPEPFRSMLALWVSQKRGRGEARKAYRPLGGRSPLLDNTRRQAEALERELHKAAPGARVFVCMRHWHPRAGVVAKDVAGWKPDKIVLLPLYPQYSTTTTLSAFEDWHAAARRAGLTAPAAEVCCYPAGEGFVHASAALVQAELKKAPRKSRLLFSAHGLPEKTILKGDPYQDQCARTAAAIVARMNIPGLDWQLCYQSRIGPLKWIGPSIEEALQRAADDKLDVVVYPLAFVSEHVETLVELDIFYRGRAAAMGINYHRAPTVGTHPAFISGLRDLALSAAAGEEEARACPAQFCKCYREVKHG